MSSHRIDTKNSLRFMLAGNSTITFRNTKSGNRFTYKIRKKDEDSPYFVALMSGPNNEYSYRYMGVIFDGKTYRWTKKSTVDYTSQSNKVFQYMFRHMLNGTLPDFIEVWHEGSCGRCGRKLTVPESIALGIGPECVKHW